MSSTTSSRRRSKRISQRKSSSDKKSENEDKQKQEDEDFDINENDQNNNTGDNDEDNIRNRLRERPSTHQIEQDMVNLEGDIHAKWKDGDVVWAKYKDYPWWPGQIEINNTSTTHHRSSRRSRKTKKPSTICVKWFGDFGTTLSVDLNILCVL